MKTFHSDELYRIEMYDSRHSHDHRAFIDLLISKDFGRSSEVFLASISGNHQEVKDMINVFNDGNKVGRIKRADGNVYDEGHIIRNILSHSKKNSYNEYVSKLDDVSHGLIVSRMIEPKTNERNTWQQTMEKNETTHISLPEEFYELVVAWDGDLKDQIYKVLYDRYSTPMLEDWKDYIVERLIEEELFEELSVYTFGIRKPIKAGLLKLTESQLENIITEGIQSYELDFAILEDLTQTDVLSKCNSLDDYLTHFSGDLAKIIQENINIRFDPKKDKHHPAFKDVNLTANENGVTGLFPPQADAVMGVANTLKEDNYCFVIGEMGSGKTPIGTVAPYISEAVSSHDGKVRPYRAIVLSPSIMVEKWKREIKERIPDVEVYEIKDWKDVIKLQNKPYKPEKIEYYIMNSNVPKYTYPMEPIKDWRYGIEDAKLRLSNIKDELHENGVTDKKFPKFRLNEYTYGTNQRNRWSEITAKTGFHCPDCGGPLYEKRDVLAGERFFEQRSGRKWTNKIKKNVNYVCKNTVETKHLPKHRIKDPAKETQECGFVLWQPEKLPMDSKQRKVSPAWLINKKLRRGFFKYLIADEVHDYKSGDSSIAQAFGQLINHTEKQIALTGTLMGGMATDVFYLLARLDPKKLLKEGITYKDESLFVQRYGVFERKYKLKNGEMRQSGTGKKPGISPHLFPMYLMRNCVFLELSDLGYALPPYQEIPVIVNMNNEHKLAYDKLEASLRNGMRRNSNLNGMRYISSYINIMTQYSDLPFNFSDIEAFDENGDLVTLARPDNFDPAIFEPAKFNQLVEDIDTELARNRKCLVYVRFTGENAYNQVDTYLYDKLKDLGYNVGILRSSGTYDGIRMPKSPQDREQWLNDMMQTHDWDILITNPTLVKVGLDLLQFPNIMFYQMDYSTYNYMQASRRSWRIKQTEPVRVFTYVYRNTIQEKILEHVAAKIDAAMSMQGKFSEEGLRSMADSDDGLHALAKKLLEEGKLDHVETIHERFQRLNQTYEEMQSATYEEYDHYEMNPIEGGIETVKKIAAGNIKDLEDKVSKGTATIVELQDYLNKFDDMFTVVQDIESYNRGRRKKDRVVEGQVALDLF